MKSMKVAADCAKLVGNDEDEQVGCQPQPPTRIFSGALYERRHADVLSLNRFERLSREQPSAQRRLADLLAAAGSPARVCPFSEGHLDSVLAIKIG